MEIYNGTYCVYIHTNKINGKKYVGQTIFGNNPNERWRNGTGYVHSPYFWNAIQKYGWDSFEHDVIASKLTKEEADNFERLLIEKLNTCDNSCGYNMTCGGDGQSGRSLTEETKQKISKALKGRKLTDETKMKIGKASEGRNVGRRHTEDELEKMSQPRKRKCQPNPNSKIYNLRSEDVKKRIQESSHKKEVLQKDIDGNVLNIYDSLSNASRATGINLGNISSCCNKRVKTVGGFIWEFK